MMFLKFSHGCWGSTYITLENLGYWKFILCWLYNFHQVITSVYVIKPFDDKVSDTPSTERLSLFICFWSNQLPKVPHLVTWSSTCMSCRSPASHFLGLTPIWLPRPLQLKRWVMSLQVVVVLMVECILSVSITRQNRRNKRLVHAQAAPELKRTVVWLVAGWLQYLPWMIRSKRANNSPHQDDARLRPKSP